MRIVVLCSSHPAMEERVFQREALTFHALGHEVKIIAPHQEKTALLEEVTIIGLSSGKGLVTRLWRNMQALCAGLIQQADLWWCHELDSLVVGIILKKVKGGRLVFDCHEYYPEKKQQKWGAKTKTLGALFLHFTRIYERLFYPAANALVAVNPHMADRLKKMQRPVFVLPNYPPLHLMKNGLQKTRIKLPSNTMIYIGGISRIRNIHGLLRILAIIRGQFSCDANLAVIGNGDPGYLGELQYLARSYQISDHFIIDKVPYREIPAVLSQAAVGLFLLKSEDLSHKWGQPVKFFEYAAAGLPVVISDLPAKRQLVETFENGYVVDPADEILVARKCVELLRDPEKRKRMGEAGRKAFLNKYNWEAVQPEIQRLFSVMQAGTQ